MECFDKYTEKERLDGDNKWLNEKTNKKETVDKGIAFWSFPDILVIDFKRFSNQNKKNQNMVHFPRELDLTKYVVGYNKDSYNMICTVYAIIQEAYKEVIILHMLK